MKKITIIIGVVLFISSCEQKLGNSYFDFDTVEWFNIEIKDASVIDLEKQSNLGINQKLKFDLIINDKPESNIDTLFVQEIEKIGFEKKVIQEAGKVNAINEIFKEKSHKELFATSCLAIYRDILIFRKEGKIEGIAKICFECKKNQIHGTTANTLKFGQSGDYSKLSRILNE